MTVFQKLINGFPSVVEPESNELLRIGVVLFVLARISTFYRVRIKDSKTVDVYSNIFFLFFGGSGEGKGKIARSFDQLDSFKSFLLEEKKEIKEFEKNALKKVAEQYLTQYSVKTVFSKETEFAVDSPKDDISERKKAITYARGKIKNIQPIMIEATRPSIESTAIAIDSCNRMSVSIRNDEFLIWIKRKQSESFELFEFMAEVYDNGEAVTKSTNVANRSVEEATISNFPLNAMFMSSESLMSDDGVSGVLKDFFVTAGARRFLTGAGEELDSPMYSESELEENFESKKNETDIYVSRFIKSCCDFSSRGIIIEPELRKFIANDRKNIKQKTKEMKLSELSKIEIRGATWRSTKIAGLLSLLNHPDSNIMTTDDYLEAKEISNLFINSFKGIIEKNWIDKKEILVNFIIKTPGCSKGDIYNLPIFSKNKTSWKKQYDDLISVITETIQTENKELIVEEDGRILKHFIKEIPQEIKEDGEFFYQFSISRDLAKEYKTRQFTLSEMMRCMENDKKINYSLGSYVGEHRKQENWEGGANCLVLDIDNDDGELTIEQTKKIFSSYTFIIQPTKSHKIEKGKKGSKERFRVIFPTSEIPKITAKRQKNIYTNFYSKFGISKFGDIKASGDTARFYYPSPHKAEYCEGTKRINWQMFDCSPEKNHSPIKSDYGKTPKNILPVLGFFSPYLSLVMGEKKRVKCPMHEDKKSSAFVSRHKESGNLYVSCSACGETWFEK